MASAGLPKIAGFCNKVAASVRFDLKHILQHVPIHDTGVLRVDGRFARQGDELFRYLDGDAHLRLGRTGTCGAGKKIEGN